MSIPAPRGIIFDFDGVIVDTEWVIYQSWVRLFAREGQEISIQTYSPCLGAGYSRWNPAEKLHRRQRSFSIALLEIRQPVY